MCHLPAASASQSVDATQRWHVVAAVAAWLLPGLGHYLLGQKQRGAILAVSIGLMWLGGLLVGGVSSIDRRSHPAWFLGQMLLSPSVLISEWYLPRVHAGAPDGPKPQVHEDDPPPAYTPSFARTNEQGVLYTALAGMLNLLAIIDVLYRDPRDMRYRSRVPASERSAGGGDGSGTVPTNPPAVGAAAGDPGAGTGGEA